MKFRTVNKWRKQITGKLEQIADFDEIVSFCKKAEAVRAHFWQIVNC